MVSLSQWKDHPVFGDAQPESALEDDFLFHYTTLQAAAGIARNSSAVPVISSGSAERSTRERDASRCHGHDDYRLGSSRTGTNREGETRIRGTVAQAPKIGSRWMFHKGFKQRKSRAT